jgi:quercetin dioxygenase-like cupin family protein
MRTTQMMAMVLMAAVTVGCSDSAPTAASAHENSGRIASANVDTPPLPIAVEMLTDRHEFTDEIAVQVRVRPDGRPTEVVHLKDASNIAVLRFTVQPGVRFPWHSHPGLVMVTITQGELVFVYANDCIKRQYPQGTAFVDPGLGNVHYAFNPTGGETVLVATFLGVPATGPLTIPVDPVKSAALDAKCGVAAAATSHAH